ncbi:MAG: VgrG-related protein [Chroococcales cyanobacterium]
MPTVSYIADLLLQIEGEDASQALMQDILQVSVEESLHLPGMFTIVIKNDYLPGRTDDQPWQHEALFSIGKSIKIGFSSSTTGASEFSEEKKGYVLQGEITAIETHFTSEAQAPIIIRGYDVSHCFHRGRYNRSFQNMTDTDIVKKIAGEVSIQTGTVDSSGDPHDYVFQENQTNMEFLRERAARNGFELFVQEGKLNFRKPKSKATLNLQWLQELQSFRVRLTSAEQVSSVEVRGWDYVQKKAISASKNSDSVITETDYGDGKKTSSAFNGKASDAKMLVVDQPVFSAKEADKIAQALFNELGGQFVHADARADGNPEIRPGKVVNLTDMGKYSGKYYITETRHLFHERTYTTEFSVRGLRGGDLLETLSPPTHLQPGQTLLVGVVTNNKDPQGMGRVRVKFPTLTEEHESNWARMVSIGAGASRGFDCLPEINDEVLVAFEHGDIHRPYVLGGVWNGKDKPPENIDQNVVQDKGEVRLRTFKTRVGHQLQFVEEDKDSSKKGVYLDTDNKKGHSIHCNDSDQFIEIKTKDGHFIRLDDKDKKIEVKTKNGHQLLMDDSGKKVNIIAKGDINIEASGKSINIKAKDITLTGTSNITLKVGGSKVELSNTGVTIKGTQVKIEGTQTTVEGKMTTITGQMTKLEGKMTTVSGTAMTKVEGAILKLN